MSNQICFSWHGTWNDRIMSNEYRGPTCVSSNRSNTFGKVHLKRLRTPQPYSYEIPPPHTHTSSRVQVYSQCCTHLYKLTSAYECRICRQRDNILVSEAISFQFVVRVALTNHVLHIFGCVQVNSLWGDIQSRKPSAIVWWRFSFFISFDISLWRLAEISSGPEAPPKILMFMHSTVGRWFQRPVWHVFVAKIAWVSRMLTPMFIKYLSNCLVYKAW